MTSIDDLLNQALIKDAQPQVAAALRLVRDHVYGLEREVEQLRICRTELASLEPDYDHAWPGEDSLDCAYREGALASIRDALKGSRD